MISLLCSEEDNSDWAAEPKEGKPDRKRKPQIEMEDVVVASCSDDATIRLWNPLQVIHLIEAKQSLTLTVE